MTDFAGVEDQYDPSAVEERVFDYWEEVDAYERTTQYRADGEPFFFVDGPPYTSGAAHLGTTWNKILKDAFIRYHRMCGYDVTDRPGYDMHGLPIETKVEEKLDFESKRDIEEFGTDAFIEECKAFAEGNLETLQADFQSLGVWMDWDNPYKTMSPEYMEAAWWGFAQAHERGLVNRGKQSITMCPRCETAIADNEVEYHEIESPSIYVRFPLRDREGSLVIWTTTPWTIPAHTFIAVDETLEYQAVRVPLDGEETLLYIAKPCVEDVLERAGISDWTVEATYTGEELIGWEYDHPLADSLAEQASGPGVGQVYHADYVEADRTGLVHSAPGHGEEDFERGAELGLDIFCPVEADGTFTDAAGEFADQFVRDANEPIIDTLREAGWLLHRGDHQHRYGQCWRCDTDIIFLATDQWFITVTEIKDDLLAAIEETQWHPQWARDNRFRDWVENARDWNVSRQRYWGIPIPIWLPEEWSGDMSEAIVISDRQELAERVDQSIDPDAVDLHKDTVDELTITENGLTYTRVPDVFDVWLDSSVATWGTLDFPGDEEAFEEYWPSDLIIEAHDQTRGWFWTLLGMSMSAIGEPPYETVLMHGYANDEDGRAMSKSIGNVIQPGEVIERHGTDPLRLFLLSINPQGEDMRFSWHEVETCQRDLNTLWNAFRFPLSYMELDDFDPERTTLETVELTTIDEWILSRLHTVIEEMNADWDAYRPDRAIDRLRGMVLEDLSRYYIQVIRRRMWDEEPTQEKQAAYATMYTVLNTTATLLAPFLPFVAEEMHRHLSGPDDHPTVHMRDWPEADPDRQDPTLETDITYLRAVEEAGATARQQGGRSRRWPVPRIVVDADAEAVAAASERLSDLLADRLNAREVSVLGPDQQWDELQWAAEADMAVLGPALGEHAEAAMRAMADAQLEEPDIGALEASLEAELGIEMDLDENAVTFVPVAPDAVVGVTIDHEGAELGDIYVDTSLTDELEADGYARELIRRIQQMRKELELDLEEEIVVEYEVEDERVASLLEQRQELIATEVRATAFDSVEGGLCQQWDIAEIPTSIAIVPVESASSQ